jgi:hypothetical protein
MFQKVSNTEGIIKLSAKSHKKKSLWDRRLLAANQQNQEAAIKKLQKNPTHFANVFIQPWVCHAEAFAA